MDSALEPRLAREITVSLSVRAEAEQHNMGGREAGLQDRLAQKVKAATG